MNKSTALLLVVSLAANVALVLGAFRAPVSAGPGSPAVVGPGGPEQTAAASPSASVGAAAAAGGAPADAVLSGVASSDLSVVRDVLRAAGVPEVYVRAVLWDRIHRAHAGEYEAIVLSRGERRYWQPVDRSGEGAARAAMREHDRAMREEFNRYFDEPRGVVADARRAREQFAFLPADKAAEAVRISRDYAELTSQVRMETVGGVTLDEDRQKLALIEEERLADLKRVLTPEEFELYELHTSSTANSMRTRLAWFAPTEQEFRAIFALQSAFDRDYGSSSFGATSREAMQARGAAQRELAAQIEQTLGAERYAEYQRATSMSYQAAAKIVDHFGLPKENAVAVHALEAKYRNASRDANRSGGDPAQAAAAAREAARAATAEVTALLGEEGARAYLDTGGNWLRNLEQQAARAAPPRP